MPRSATGVQLFSIFCKRAKSFLRFLLFEVRLIEEPDWSLLDNFSVLWYVSSSCRGNYFHMIDEILSLAEYGSRCPFP